MIATFQDISIIELLHTLQEPAPQYVLGCGPAVATIGTSPESGLINKLLWLLRCLGCPFTGLFYACGIRNDPIAMSIYWLTSDHFRRDGNILPYRPFGLYTMKIAEDERNEEVIRLLKECMAEASVLGRLSSLASAYYIFLGIFTGLIKALQIGPCTEEDWPYLPLALAWTLPAICRRVFGGKMIVNDPRVRLRDMHVVPILPVQKYIAAEAYISQYCLLFGEKSVEGLLSHTRSWWLELFGGCTINNLSTIKSFFINASVVFNLWLPPISER
uniref:Uncharacterized protein n=1 Tax=Rhizophagus irregularis (strain DAOM 181602 / DAOM 197198 / MUCL 43194) TaxID=747089 RepID=U9U4L9_RHIID